MNRYPVELQMSAYECELKDKFIKTLDKLPKTNHTPDLTHGLIGHVTISGIKIMESKFLKPGFVQMVYNDKSKVVFYESEGWIKQLNLPPLEDIWRMAWEV